MKKGLGLFVFVLFVLSFVRLVSGAGGSTTETNFNIAGCPLPGGGGLAIDTCSRGAIDGEYYCDVIGDDALVTREVGVGCSMGDLSYELGEPFCCPAGMFCNATSGAFKCDYRTEQCYDQLTKVDCEAIGCIWLDEEGICVDGTRDYGCSLYTNEPECLADVWNLGRTGIGTEVCGTYLECDDVSYTIPFESCECRWVGGVCDLYMEGSQTYYDDEETKDWFSCLKNYTVANCIEGEQDVSWIATGTTYGDFPVECLAIMGCSDGNSTRVCGEPVIKLSGFGLFALFASIVLIGLYYTLRERLDFRN